VVLAPFGVQYSPFMDAADAGIDLIFTYAWNFSRDKGKRNIDAYKELYESRGGEVYFVELVAPVDVRAERAANPDRFDNKANAAGADEVRNLEGEQKFISPSPFYYSDKYLQIEAVDKSPSAIAQQIIDWLSVCAKYEILRSRRPRHAAVVASFE
jgi:hypothetical protein